MYVYTQPMAEQEGGPSRMVSLTSLLVDKLSAKVTGVTEPHVLHHARLAQTRFHGSLPLRTGA